MNVGVEEKIGTLLVSDGSQNSKDWERSTAWSSAFCRLVHTLVKRVTTPWVQLATLCPHIAKNQPMTENLVMQSLRRFSQVRDMGRNFFFPQKNKQKTMWRIEIPSNNPASLWIELARLKQFHLNPCSAPQWLCDFEQITQLAWPLVSSSTKWISPTLED